MGAGRLIDELRLLTKSAIEPHERHRYQEYEDYCFVENLIRHLVFEESKHWLSY